MKQIKRFFLKKPFFQQPCVSRTINSNRNPSASTLVNVGVRLRRRRPSRVPRGGTRRKKCAFNGPRSTCGPLPRDRDATGAATVLSRLVSPHCSPYDCGDSILHRRCRSFGFVTISVEFVDFTSAYALVARDLRPLSAALFVKIRNQTFALVRFPTNDRRALAAQQYRKSDDVDRGTCLA